MNNIFDKIINFDKCTSCQTCSGICPKNAISIVLNEQGFYRPIIDLNKCNNCGLCKKVCYRFDKDVLMSDDYIKIYALQNTDKELLKTVTSGGIAYTLAKNAIKKGYKVVGVSYDYDKNIAITEISDAKIEQFKGSKYIQSYTENTFKKIISDNSDTKYMVFGTPCQIYSIDKAAKLKGIRNKFILVDLFCHGCPSMLLWEKCLKQAQEIMKVDKFDKVEFRSKKRGWHEFCLYFESGNKKYLTKNEFDSFYSLFFSDLVLNRACMDCKLRSTLSYTDIRLGDFWGHHYDTNLDGVSAVVSVSEAGQQWLNELLDETIIKEHTLEDIIKYQSYGKLYTYNDTIRTKLIDLLKSEKSINKIIKEYETFIPFKSKIKLFLKKCSVLLPKLFKDKIRQNIHKRYIS